MDTNTLGGLTVTAPAGAVCGLYTGVPTAVVFSKIIDPEKALPASQVTYQDGRDFYYYENLQPGLYYCTASLDGFNSLSQTLLYTEEKAGMQLDLNPVKLAGNGYEAGFVMRCTQEHIDRQMISHRDTWGDAYADIFQTPQFLNKIGRGVHQQTTNEEMMDFITKLDNTCPYMHVFSLGKSPKYGYDMPLVLFTKEKVAGMTLDEAARVVRGNGKVTIQYDAQCHSTEPASTEGALAMMRKLCSDYGNELLDSLDIYIIPRINLDGAFEVTRTSPTTKEDMNRDYLRVHNREIAMVISAYNRFLPEIVLDGHEKRTAILRSENDLCTDMELQVGAGSLNHPAEMTALGMKIALKTLENGRKLGLRTHFYDKLASAAGGSAGSSYFGTRNSLSFLVETPGQVICGMEFMERRVLAHYIFADTIFRYAVEHGTEILETVHSSRQYMIHAGSIYDENRMMVLQHDKAETGRWATPLLHAPTGQVVDPNHSEPYYEHMTAVRTRPRATAYVLPKDLAHEQEIFRVLDIHAIPYHSLPAGSVVKLKQYVQQGEEMILTPETAVCFAGGAYVLPNTVPSTVLSVVMEPDFNKESGRKMTLLSMGLIEQDAEGALPVYRYCRDLVDGTVKIESNQ